MTLNEWGAASFGFVIGWVTYRTVRRSPTTGLSDIATVIGAVGGAAVTTLFPSADRPFGAYGIGLAIGFILYLITAMIVSSVSGAGIGAVKEWLGSEGVEGGTNQPTPRPKIPTYPG
jgi:hypothetical protein